MKAEKDIKQPEQGNLKDISDSFCVGRMNNVEFTQYLRYQYEKMKFERRKSIFFS